MFKKYEYKIEKDESYEILPWIVYGDTGLIFYDWWFIKSFKTKEEAESYITKLQKEKEVWYY